MIDGAERTAVHNAVEGREPLSGAGGFAGRIGTELVRDVLGRYPLFVERTVSDPTRPACWSFDLTDLDDPVSVPAGHRVDADGSERIFSLPDPVVTADEEHAVTDIRDRVTASVDALSTTDMAVAFSGGLDSAILAALLDVPLYVAGFPGSHDFEAAQVGAELLDADLTVVELSHDDLETAVTDVAHATGRTNAMDVQIALGLFLTGQQASKDGYSRLVTGQGADELFGGYAKVAKAPDDPRVEADSIRGARREVLQTLPDQLERDVLALRASGVEPVVPLLDDAVVEAALSLPEELLVSADGTRKVALRRAASEWLPVEIVNRDKKAVQYGSLIAREIDRLARRAGFKRRMDDHVTKYVESLVGRTDGTNSIP